jgi:short-subunit dehydrogenase
VSVSEAPEGLSVVITGAAGGLGSAIARALHERGARLLLVDIAGEPLDDLTTTLCVDGLVADVAELDDRERIAALCDSLGMTPDVLINNAGVERASEFVRLQPAEIRRALDVNLLGAMLLTHALLPAMQRRRQGHVITIASMAGIKPVPFNAVYNTAKAGLVAFSTSLSKELEGSGVHATVVCPAAVREVGMWARASGRLTANRFVDSSTVSANAVVAAVLRAIARQPRRVLVGSPLVRAGALLSALSPHVDRATDRLSRIDAVYHERINTDRENRF